MNGVIINANHVHARRAAVNPIARHYEEKGERPYIKWSCPVCEAIGNHRVSIPEGIPECPLCGVHLNWNQKPEVGDQVIILGDDILLAGTICTVKEIVEDGTMYLLSFGEREGLYPACGVSLLEEEEL